MLLSKIYSAKQKWNNEIEIGSVAKATKNAVKNLAFGKTHFLTKIGGWVEVVIQAISLVVDFNQGRLCI